ncbi:dihydrofolate reductase family protein [Frigoribacterium faeni]|uniref:Dihydrofolate reductase n=1 Tax=Frigoribacterium faeni TaxID=145483 RepID=A0A7W3PJ52_9MICO|nr:dihydrofolate reductase family protein [Frigoribacterium faeni]MBA8813703.1 dihydrofolate reductase [Frigoribacterium faeni]BFF14995.1 dihydrofolate reductase family protein [Microbacterium flavescens]GEK83348.1 dihydrofolate reductase [Frigoribacterium faeni]
MIHDRNWKGCVFIGTSLEGFIARPDGNLDWLTDPTPRPHTTGTSKHAALTWETFFPTIDTLVMGRTTYETVQGFDPWPFTEKRVIVLSTRLHPDERVEIARTVDDAADMLRAGAAARVYVDGGRTIQSFLAKGLIDEITVAIAPVLIGRGHRLFGDLADDVQLTMRGHHSSEGDGLLRVTYDISRP